MADLKEPSAMDWAKAQATDLYNTGKHIVTGGQKDYEAFKNTKAVAERAKAARKSPSLGWDKGGKVK